MGHPRTISEKGKETSCARNLTALQSPLCVMLAWSSAAGQRPSGTAARAPAGGLRLAFETYTLPNGLTVILSTDRTTPTVAVNIWYHVGSKNEVPGRTGFAHLFEHVMFTGSGHVPYGLHDKLTEGVGGIEQRHDVERPHDLLRDRPVELPRVGAVDRGRSHGVPARLARSREAERAARHREERAAAERRQPAVRPRRARFSRRRPIRRRIRTRGPSSAAWKISRPRPKRTSRTSSASTTRRTTRFSPSSATSIRRRRRRGCTKYFGDIPRGKPITRPAVAPVTLDAEQRLVFEDRVQVPRLYIQWPTVGEKNDDRFALDVLGAILSGPRTARLTKALVYDKQSAASVSAGQSTNEDVGEFVMTITPRPGNIADRPRGRRPTRSSRGSRREGPTAEEMQKATAGEELSFVRGLESNLGKALQLADGAGYPRRSRLLPHRVPEDASR